MFSLLRFPTVLTVCGLALFSTAFPADLVCAQTQGELTAPSVEVYGGQPLISSPDSEGVLPEGMTWNRPLKAGDLALPRAEKTKASKKKAAPRPTLPVGELKPPVMAGTQGKSAAKPPQISATSGSTSGVMLLQGMKNVLQQAGHNPAIPKSDIEASEPAKNLPLGEGELQAPRLEKPAVKAASGPVTIDGVTYEPGQEPKRLGAGGRVAPGTEIVMQPSGAPKATDMAEPPPSLASIVDGEVPAPSAEPSSQVREGDESVFGQAVEDKAKEEKDDSSFIDRLFGDDEKKEESAPVVAAMKEECQPSVERWTRDCRDAGYPAYFKGEIVGETRLVCPEGEAREVWISNTCSASFVNEPAPAAKTQDIAFAPEEKESAVAEQAAAQPVVIDSASAEPQDGACGSASGLASLTKPLSDLCQKGRATSVTGEGPWRWSCEGIKGGMSVSCAAPAASVKAAKEADEAARAAAASSVVEDGKCGAAAEGGHMAAPSENLCLKGAASAVSGSGPWTWACGGKNGGQAAACTAQKKTDGRCGAASRIGADGMPARDLCAAGYASAVTGQGPWHWTCSGLYGGEAATCAAEPRLDAVCGAASAGGHRAKPEAALCAVGSPSSVEGDGPWLWSCNGENGGATVSCRANMAVDASCGAAHGSQFTDAPGKGLCAKGRASLVTGEGPWHWTCMGADGGQTVSCAASRGSEESLKDSVACGEASEILVLSKPSEKLCAAGQPSEVSGDGPWSWACADAAGHSVNCTSLAASDGACGAAAEKASSSMPHAGLCAAGAPGEVKPDRANAKWLWTCDGAMGGASAACAAPISPALANASEEKDETPADVTAACGNAAGQGFMAAPEDSLCAAGEASRVKGDGPWHWTCKAGGKKGVEVSCEASKLTDGACGTANGSIQRTAPMTGLCSSGTPTQLFGGGPWMWSCIGSGGGNSVSCSALSQAQTKVDGTCGAAAGVAVPEEPTANLCDSGVPSSVYGEGPWTWTCSGLNGGIASTCRANKVAVKAPSAPGPLVNGLCGRANGVALASAPEEGLCAAGTTTGVAGNGPWTWSCLGRNGGMTVSCVAPLMPPAPIVGACGSSSGVPSLTAPRGSLCAAGIASAVSGRGPWTWSCSGTNGGGAVSCVAPLAGKGGAGLPSLSTPGLPSAEAPAPAKAPVGLVTPALPAGEKLEPVKSKKIPNRKSSKPESKLEAPKAPEAIPALPEGVKALKAPAGAAFVPTPGIVPPVKDSAGNPVPRARLVLEPEISTLSFAAGTDQLDKNGVEIVEKLARILAAHDDARITLLSYASTGIDRSPREARKLSLNRALAIRSLLTGKGIPTNRVDVRPMGANVPSGDMDRVDVKVN